MTENVKSEAVTKNLKTIFIDSFKKMFDFKSRASKYDYWGFMLANGLVGILLAILAFFSATLGVVGIYGYFVIYVAYAIFQTIAVLSLSVRRLHDTNHSGKWLFGIFVPFLFAIAVSALNSISNYQSGADAPSRSVVIFTAFVVVVLSIAFLVMMCKKGNAEENRFGKVVVENPNSNKLANICCLLYFVISIVGGVLNVAMDKGNADENTQINGIASGTAVVDTRNSEAEEETTEPVASETESSATEEMNVETPSVPLHENAE